MLGTATTLSRGRCFVAARDLNAGECILEEMSMNCVLSPINPQDQVEASLVRCYNSEVQPFAALLTHRILQLYKSTPKLRDMVASLCCNNPYWTRDVYEGLEASSQIIKTVIPHDAIAIDEALSILKRITLNAFSITDELLQPIGLGLFLRATLFNHSCAPNATQSFIIINDTTVQLRIHANINIPKGSEVTISYIDVGYPSWWRRRQLMLNYGFFCSCCRCSSADKIQDEMRCPLPSCRGYLRPHSDNAYLYYCWLNNSAEHYVIPDSILPIPVAGRVLDCNYSCNICLATRAGIRNAQEFQACSELLIRGRKAAHADTALCIIAEACERLQALLFSDHYALVHAMTEHATAALFAQEFHMALRITQSYINSLERMYPECNPFLCIQKLQLTKLLQFVGRNDDAINLIKGTINILRTTHGDDHPLCIQALSLL